MAILDLQGLQAASGQRNGKSGASKCCGGCGGSDAGSGLSLAFC